MSERIELRTRTVVWVLIAASEVAAYVLTVFADVSPIVRYVAAWYTLVVGFLLFAAVAITLSVVLRDHGRLDSAQGWLLRAFLFW
jgi:hypothetical protein